MYEVEIRFQFDEVGHIWMDLPTLAKLSWRREYWHTEMYGRQLFETGELLRISKITTKHSGRAEYYLGWKGVDSGQFANIREEMGEGITDGIERSVILKSLGCNTLRHKTYQSVVSALENQGHASFMAFAGENEVASDTALQMHFKVMHCQDIIPSLLLEVEKTAESLNEALFLEEELKKFAHENGLLRRIVREEPPTLLFRMQTGKNF